MPLYEYRCGHCGHEVELLRKVSDQSVIACPSCGATDMHKKVTAAGFQLKGTGWYATDFRNAGKAAPRTDKADEGTAPGDGKAAAKPEAGGADAAKADTAKPDNAKVDAAKPAAPAASGAAPSSSSAG